MNTNQLKYFVSVGEFRSFSKAAEQNFISQKFTNYKSNYYSN